MISKGEWEKIPWADVKIGVYYTSIEFLETGEKIKVRPRRLVLLDEDGKEMKGVLSNFLSSLDDGKGGVKW